MNEMRINNMNTSKLDEGSLVDGLYPARIFEHDYVTGVLGLSIPLNESAPYSKVTRSQIIREHLLFEGFFDDFKKLAGELKTASLGLRFMMEVPARVKVFMKDLMEKGIMPLYEKIKSWLDIAIGVSKAFMKKHPPLKTLMKFATSTKKVIINTIKKVKSMTGWKQALLGIAAVSGLAFLAKKLMENSELTDMKRQKNFITMLHKTGQISSDDAKAELISLFDKADASGFSGGALLDHYDRTLPWNMAGAPASFTLTEAIYGTNTPERLDEFLGKMVDKVKGAIGKGKKDDGKSAPPVSDKEKGKITKGADAIKEFLSPYLDTIKKVGTGILKKLAIDAALGAISGGVASFWKWIKGTYGNLKMVFTLIGPTMKSFVNKIKNPKQEEQEATKGEDDPTDKK